MRIEIAAPNPEDHPSTMSEADLIERLRDHVASERVWRRDRVRKTINASPPFRLTDDSDRAGVLDRLIADGWGQSGTMHSRWRDLLRDVDLHDRAAALVQLAERVDPASLNLLLTAWWPELEDHHLIGTGTFVRLFRRAGYVFDQPAEVADSPSSALMVFRGTDCPAPDAVHGMSWTVDPVVADWYAGRFADRARRRLGWVWGATVNPDSVLARFTGYGDAEIVVDPRGLRDVTCLALVPDGRAHPSSARRPARAASPWD